MNKNDPHLNKLSWGVFFISLSVLFFELSLVRLFSVALSPSLAFFAVTLIFFGLTLGGLTVYFLNSLFSDKNFYIKLGYLGSLFGFLLIAFVYIFINIDPLSKAASFKMIWLAALPITLANVYLSYIFSVKADKIGKIYAFDLSGAGIGVMVCLILLSHMSPVGVILIAAFIALGSSFLFIENKKQAYLLGFILLSFFIFFTKNGFPDIKYTKRGFEENTVFSKWNSFSRISLLSEKEKRFLYSLPSPDIQTVGQMGIEIDADAYTSVLNFNGDLNSVNFLKKDLSSFAYHLNSSGKSLIIGPGGGRDVLTALLFNNKVTGVDINPIIVNNLMENRLKDFSGGLYFRPNVNIKVAEGRSFIKKDGNRYDTIELSLVDTWASTAAGNLAIVEGYLYTSEAFEDYLQHLNQGGVLTISRWSLDGEKLISLYFNAAEKLGIKDPSKNIIVIGKTDGRVGLYNYLFKKEPFTKEEINKASQFVKANGFSNIYIPGQPLNNEYNSFILSDNWHDFVEHYPLNIAPATDDKPFFFFTLPVSELTRFHFIETYLPDGGLGLAFRFALIFTVICVLLPFMFSFKKLKGFSADAIWFLLYFGLIGLSFMLIEISLIQKFILYLEYPIYSYSVVIATLLIFAGFGSLKAQQRNTGTKNFTSAVLILSIFFIIYSVFGNQLIKNTISLEIYKKIFLTVLINSLPAYFMGMMMPLGIRKMNDSSMSYLTSWCWAVNGSASILASVISVFLALLYGFNGVILIGMAGYILSLLPIFFIRSRTVG